MIGGLLDVPWHLHRDGGLDVSILRAALKIMSSLRRLKATAVIRVGKLSRSEHTESVLGNLHIAKKAIADGLLPTVLFRRVYISYADRFVVLEPW